MAADWWAFRPSRHKSDDEEELEDGELVGSTASSEFSEKSVLQRPIWSWQTRDKNEFPTAFTRRSFLSSPEGPETSARLRSENLAMKEAQAEAVGPTIVQTSKRSTLRTDPHIDMSLDDIIKLQFQTQNENTRHVQYYSPTRHVQYQPSNRHGHHYHPKRHGHHHHAKRHGHHQPPDRDYRRQPPKPDEYHHPPSRGGHRKPSSRDGRHKPYTRDGHHKPYTRDGHSTRNRDHRPHSRDVCYQPSDNRRDFYSVTMFPGPPRLRKYFRQRSQSRRSFQNSSKHRPFSSIAQRVPPDRDWSRNDADRGRNRSRGYAASQANDKTKSTSRQFRNPKSRIERSRPERFRPDRSGPDRSGAERSGAERSGAERSGPERSGPDRSGPERSGPERSGSERFGPDKSGSERFGPDRSGAERSGPDRSGPDRSGPNRSGPSRSGPERSGPGRSGPKRFGPDRSGPDRFGPDRAGPERFGPYRYGLDRSGRERFGSDRSRPERFGPKILGRKLMHKLSPNDARRKIRQQQQKQQRDDIVNLNRGIPPHKIRSTERKSPNRNRYQVEMKPGSILTVSLANVQVTHEEQPDRPKRSVDTPSCHNNKWDLSESEKFQPKGISLRYNFRAVANQTKMTLNERFSGLKIIKGNFAVNKPSNRTVTMP